MSTLQNSINGVDSSVAVIIPSKPNPLTVTYKDLLAECSSFQRKLAAIGITNRSPVSIATINSYEFIVSFLAASWQRGIAAPLNPAYKQEEFEFYIEDIKSAIVLVPRGRMLPMRRPSGPLASLTLLLRSATGTTRRRRWP